jgi:hypothetical protein
MTFPASTTLTFVLEILPAIIARPSHSEVFDLAQSKVLRGKSRRFQDRVRVLMRDLPALASEAKAIAWE